MKKEACRGGGGREGEKGKGRGSFEEREGGRETERERGSKEREGGREREREKERKVCTYI